jgi:hypothetical protein
MLFLALAGLAIGTYLFSRRRRRSDPPAGGRQLKSDPSLGDSGPLGEAFEGRTPLVRDHVPDGSRNHYAAAITAYSYQVASTSPPAASWSRRHPWIQTGCTVLMVMLVACFGVTISRRLQALTEAQHANQSAALGSQQLLRTEQRAWVGMMDAVALPLRPDGGGFAVKVQNTGKTPAFDVQFSAMIIFSDSEKLGGAEAPNQGVVTPLGTLLPGAAYTTNVLFRTSPEAVRALVNHEQRAVGWIWMSYTDVFKTPHASRNCFYLSSVQPCETFNELN